LFSNQCAGYFRDTGACFEFEDSEVDTVDCCSDRTKFTPTTTEPAVQDPDFCPESVCKTGAGPCVFGYTPTQEDGENICLDYMIEATEDSKGICYPRSTNCAETEGLKKTTQPPAVTDGPGGDDDVDESTITTTTTTKPSDYENCGDCFEGTSGPCRSVSFVPNTDKYVCLPYLANTDLADNVAIFGNELSGPQCMQTTVKCQDWTTLETSTSTTYTSVTTSTSTTGTSTTNTPKKDPAGEFYADTMNDLIAGWEQLYCGQEPGDPELFSSTYSPVVIPSEELNTAMIRAWMAEHFHKAAQDDMQEQRLPEEVGAGFGETLCAGPNQACTCRGLVRRSIKPSVSWGKFDCIAETFQKVANEFEPALNNGDGNCYCTESGLEEIEQTYQKERSQANIVMAGKALMELAEQVGAARRCSAGKNEGPGDGPNSVNINRAEGEPPQFERSSDDNATQFINTECRTECRSVNGAELDRFMQEAGYNDRGTFLVDKAAELEATFAYIFRFFKNDKATIYDNFNVAAVSDGDKTYREQHKVYEDEASWKAFRLKLETPNQAKNERFEAADTIAADDLYLALGSRQASGTQTGCYPGGLKHGLGMCSCEMNVMPPTTRPASVATIGPVIITETTLVTIPTTTSISTTTTTCGPGSFLDYCNCEYGYKGPMIGFKASRNINKDVTITNERGVADVEACAAMCEAETKCKSFGWKEKDTVQSDFANGASACMMYNRELTKIGIDSKEELAKDENSDAAARLTENGGFNHYTPSDSCVTTTSAPTTVTVTTVTTATTVTTVTNNVTAAPTMPTTITTTTTETYGTPAYNNLPTIVNGQCLFGEPREQIDVCQANCAKQHECVGVFYYFNPLDNLVDCEKARKASMPAKGKDKFTDLFDRMATCNTTENSRCSNTCADYQLCSNAESTDGSYECIPCISQVTKVQKCDALYNIATTAGSKLKAGADAEPLTSCVMLTALCTGDDCLKLTEESFLRSISFEKKIIGENAMTTPATTMTSTPTSTVTTSVTTSETSTPTSTMVSTPSVTVVSTATTTATSTATETITSTYTNTTVSSTTTTYTNTTVTSTSTTATTTTTTATSTTTTTGSTTTITTTSMTSSTTTASTTTTSTGTTTTGTTTTGTTTTAAYIRYKTVYDTKPSGMGRRFGNAFKSEDRRFLVKYDGTRDMGYLGRVESDGTINGAGKRCQTLCNEDPLCLAIFVWNQLDHVAMADRTNPDKPGFNCAGLTSQAVYGNYYSQDNYIGGLSDAELSIAKEEGLLTVEEDSLISDTRQGFKGQSLSIVKEFLWNTRAQCTVSSSGDCYVSNTAELGPCKVGSIKADGVNGVPYNGACLHPATGFCMEEVPGSAQCLSGFVHRGKQYIDTARASEL
jgi:hypothetical protein